MMWSVVRRLRLGLLIGGLAVVTGLALVAAACGGDDDGGDGNGDDVPVATDDGSVEGDATAACDAFVAYSQAFDIDEDLEAGIASLKDFASAGSQHGPAAGGPPLPPPP